MEGRPQFEKYPAALKTCFNQIVLAQGPVTRRPGSIYVAQTKDMSVAGRLMRFKFSDEQAYIMELGDEFARFFSNHGRDESVRTITGAANNGSGKIRVQVADTTGLYDGNSTTITGVVGTTEANATWIIDVIDGTHFDLVGSTFTHAYVSGGTATTITELPLPYSTAELFDLIASQSNDKLYVAHSAHAPATINRFSETNWTHTAIDFVDGPYLEVNTTTTTLTFGGQGPGSVSCTASGVTGINGDTGFQSTDVGRHIRARTPGAGWGWGKITAVADTTHCTVNLVQPVGGTIKISGAADNGSGLIRITTASDHTFVSGTRLTLAGIIGTTEANGTWPITVLDELHFDLQGSAFVHAYVSGGTIAASTTLWRLGAFSDTTGYPTCVTFYGNRLGWGGCPALPQTIFFSVTDNYVNHAPTAYDVLGTVADNNALDFTLVSEDSQTIRWMIGDSNGLLVGTSSAEWRVTPNSQGGALTPTNVYAAPMTFNGSINVPALRAGQTTMMLQKARRKIRDMNFTFYENKYVAPDTTIFAQHVSKTGLYELAYQQEPTSLLWAKRGDGKLACLTFEKDYDVAGWHRHAMGGVADADGAHAIVESIESVSTPDGTGDELWLMVQRYVNGQEVRYIEYLGPIWENEDDRLRAVHLDCSLTYDGAATTSISGFDHLKGETITVMVDGAAHPDVTVSNAGVITLDTAGSVVIGGYSYNSDGQTLRNNAGAADGTAQGKTQRKNRVTFRLLDTLGLEVGPSFDLLTPRTTRTLGDPLGEAVPLFTGDDGETWEGDYSTEDLICWRYSGPFPGTMLAIMPQQHTMDR